MAAVELRTALDHIRYSRNVAHGYSRAIQRLFDYTETYIDEAENEARRGRKAVWTQGQWEIPLIYASDTIPVAFSEVGRISDQRAITMSEDYFQVPSETCSMVKATLGEWYLRKDAPMKPEEPYWALSALLMPRIIEKMCIRWNPWPAFYWTVNGRELRFISVKLSSSKSRR
jgi:hypothetical protein